LFFGNLATFWLGLQMDYELDTVMVRFGEAMEKDVTPLPKIG
jgi:hypothetical protein